MAWPFVALIWLLREVISTPVRGEKYGIGFDFTPSGATSGVAFTNGSRIPLARVEGDVVWRDMMSHLSTDLRARYLHYGPAYVQPMAQMIRSLAAETSRVFGRHITNASASIPISNSGSEWGAPYSRLIKESFAAAEIEYLEILPWETYDEGEPLINIGNSILAGHGLGLCEPYYTASTRCAWEQHLPSEAYFFAGYHANAIEIFTTSKMVDAYAIHAYRYPNYHLGAEMRHQNPREDYYWEEVWDQIRLPMMKVRWQLPTKVIVYGEFSTNEHFRDLLRQMLQEWSTGQDLPEWIEDGVNSTFAGALGAAEMAMRKPSWEGNYKRRVDGHLEAGSQVVL